MGQKIAPADTLFGQLQRGHGAGFLWAMKEAPETVRPLVIECITHDPRIDSQVEERSTYYARLALLVRLDLGPLDQHLHLNDDSIETYYGWKTALTIDVLGQLAKRNYPPALHILRAYIEYGFNWGEALGELAEVPIEFAVEDLDEVLCRRFAHGREMYDHKGFTDYYTDAIAKVYRKWRRANPRFAKLLNEAEANFPPRGNKNAKGDKNAFEDIPLSELLSTVKMGNLKGVIAALPGKVRQGDKDLLLSAFSGDNPPQWIMAFHGLQEIGQAGLAYGCLLNNLKAYFTGLEERKGPLLRATANVMLALPDEMIHDLARQWFHAPQTQWWLEVIADHLLERTATPEDIPMIIAMLRECQREVNEYEKAHYHICSMLDMLARFRSAGPFPEVETEFDVTGYSYNRLRAAKAMQANAPEYFAGRMAFECMWDCDEEARALGCQAVDLNRPGVLTRLRELADDAFEEEEVRNAASNRLRETAPDIQL